MKYLKIIFVNNTNFFSITFHKVEDQHIAEMSMFQFQLGTLLHVKMSTLSM